VPVIAESGPGGGCLLAPDYRTDLTGLTHDEAQSLLLAAPLGPLADLGMSGALQAGLLKLLAALPETARGAAEHARLRVHVDMRGWFRAVESTPLLPALQAAVWGDLRLRIVHAKDGGEERDRTVDPLGLVAKLSVWYLVADTVDGLRVFRVSRIASVEQTGERFCRPAGFDLAAYWAEWSSSFRGTLPSYIVRLAVEPRLLPELAWAVRETATALQQRACARADGRLQLEVDFETLADARTFLLRWGDGVEAEQPGELRVAVHAWSRRLARQYARPSGTPDDGPALGFLPSEG
jgi:predicted DNA-binding transcriptional regulator YafY